RALGGVETEFELTVGIVRGKHVEPVCRHGTIAERGTADHVGDGRPATDELGDAALQLGLTPVRYVAAPCASRSQRRTSPDLADSHARLTAAEVFPAPPLVEYTATIFIPHTLRIGTRRQSLA